MTKKAPGNHYRKGITWIDLVKLFPDDAVAEKWFEAQRWQDGIYCPGCGSVNIQKKAKHKTMAHRCRDCRKFFSVKIGTAMESSKLGYQVWAFAIYIMHTGLKGQSSMKMHRDLGITQKSAWHLAHRIRECWSGKPSMFSGPVEVDETYMGGTRKNMSKAKQKTLTGRGPVGKTAVIGAKDRETNQVVAKVIQNTGVPTLQGFVKESAAFDAIVYTDDAAAYRGMPFEHDSVTHSVGEYVRGEVHTNGIESFWSMLKRAHKGTYHKISPKHLNRYVTEFAGRHNVREQDTIDQMSKAVRGMAGKRLRYVDLTE